MIGHSLMYRLVYCQSKNGYIVYERFSFMVYLVIDCSGKESNISATVSEIDRRNFGLCFELLGGAGSVPNFSHLSESSAYSPQKKFNAFELVDSINSSTVSISFSEHLALPRPLS